MSTSQTEMNPNWARPEKRRSGCGGGMSCLLIGCGGMFLLCCGVVTWGYFYVRSMVIQDPTEIAAQRDRIAKIDLPESLKPAVGMNLKFPFVGDIGAGVVYADTDDCSTLMLMSINRSFAEKQKGNGNFQEMLEQGLRQPGGEQKEDFQVSESHEKQFTVRGQQVKFYFATGKSKKSGKELLQVTGTFQGDLGPTIFMFLGDPKKYDEAAVSKIIESIK